MEVVSFDVWLDLLLDLLSLDLLLLSDLLSDLSVRSETSILEKSVLDFAGGEMT